ncbi:MAG: hypothetical protein M0D53_12060 [Flavobacterium sp. JAD_PAG50586_2]|nr:MAG: hypothetical protein M0D53_12060 [Flavobacterium sp. JAD_PAG50586_2]
MEKEILERLQEAEIRYKKMKILFWGFLSPTLIAIFCLGFTKIEKFDIIRTKAIIIENENSRDRILVGFPIPFGKRMFRNTRILWYTETGWKLNGRGVNTTDDGKSRPIIELNNESNTTLNGISPEEGGRGIIIGGLFF